MVGWGWFGIFGGWCTPIQEFELECGAFKPNMSDKELSLERYFIGSWFRYLVILALHYML